MFGRSHGSGTHDELGGLVHWPSKQVIVNDPGGIHAHPGAQYVSHVCPDWNEPVHVCEMNPSGIVGCEHNAAATHTCCESVPDESHVAVSG